MIARIGRLGLAASLVASLAGCAASTAQPLAPSPAPDDRVQQVERQAKSVGFDLSAVSRRGAYRNTVAVGGDTESFVRRTDSLTYIAGNDRYGFGEKIGVFAGSDAALLARSHVVLAVLGVPPSEISRVRIQHEYGRVGQFDPAAGTVKAEPQQLLNRIVSFRRSVGNVPVFSSYARVGLTRSGGVGMLRVHWPRIDAQTLKSAQALQARVRQGFKPPDVVGARPEIVTAGIVHSPAAGEVMDVAAVIRVVYRPTDAQHGKKPVRLYDASGKSVPEPRVFLKPPPLPRGTRAAAELIPSSR